jgi:UDPglucose 6-dehydrogenase
MNIAFLGASHLSICSAIAVDKLGYYPEIFDLNTIKLNAIAQGNLDLSEPGVKEHVDSDGSKIKFSDDLSKLKNHTLVIVSLDVKVNQLGESILDDLEELIDQALDFVLPTTIVVIMSQVSPGFTRLIATRHNKIYYQMETLVFGQAIDRAINPERLVVGKANMDLNIDDLYSDYLRSFNCPIIEMTYEEAEFSKQCANIYLASTITTTNSLAELCEKNSFSWKRISSGLKLDKRIGKYAYLQPGLGIGGTNIVRDLKNVKQNMEKDCINSEWLQAIDNTSAYHREWLFNKVITSINNFDKSPIVGILGLTYKENIASVYGSASFDVLQRMRSKNQWMVYDPLWKIESSPNVQQVPDMEIVFNNCDIVVIGNSDNRYVKFNLVDIKKEIYLIDPFNLFTGKAINSNITKYSIGEKN